MKYTIISGSSRQDSQSIKVASYIEYLLEERYGQNVHLLNLATVNLKYWDESFWQKDQECDHDWAQVRQELFTSDALVIVVPEWNGMIPNALKNIFHLSTMGELANKPALIVSISAGVNGVYPICELRLNSYKNTFICYMPQQVIIRNVGNVLNDFYHDKNDDDKNIKERLDYTLQLLHVYAGAFQQIRSAAITKNNKYPHGM